MKKISLFLCIICIMMLCSCEEHVVPKPAEAELYTFQAYSVLTQDKDGYIAVRDHTTITNYQSWVATFLVVAESEEDIKKNWDYRLVFCDAPLDTLIVQNEIYYVPFTAETHYVYINKELKLIQFDDKAYCLYEQPLEDWMTALESMIYE